uniref:Uncharacterized protein n=1 Tax=Solanum lycopersicum TaxID=4081 RepID=K4B5A1_SOLLC
MAYYSGINFTFFLMDKSQGADL